jgi:hypothetical protein
MRRRAFLSWSVGLLAGCASGAALHTGPSNLVAREKAALAQGKPRNGQRGFRRLWKSPTIKAWGLLKWDPDRSSAVPSVPAGLLQAIRDDLGRLNQQVATGESLSLVVTVYAYDRGGWLSPPSAAYELVARNPAGQVVWCAEDEVSAPPELAKTLADPSELILAREVGRKVRLEFGL